jgi:hypothetical protein
MLVLFTDANTHKVLHKSTTGGTQLDEADSLNALKEELLSRKIRVLIFGPKDVDEYMKVGAWNNCKYAPMEKTTETLKNFKDSVLFKEEIVKRVAESVSKSASQPVAYGG